jgi:hypothetical protein
MTKKTSDRREPEATPTSVREPRRHSHADSTEIFAPHAQPPRVAAMARNGMRATIGERIG